MAAAEPERLVRRLRVALVLVAMLVGVLLIAVLGILFYWDQYLLGDRGEDPFTRGPYVVGVTGTAAEVRFLGPAPERVRLTAVAPDGTDVEAVEGRFSGLEPGRRYVWTAAIDGRGEASGSFRTAPDDPDAEVVFGVVADYGSGEAGQYAVGRGLDAIDPAFVLTAGDNSYLVASERLIDRNIIDPFAGVLREAPLIVGLGDHDTFLTAGRQALVDAFAMPGDGLHYVYEYGPVQVVVLGIDGDEATIAFAEQALAEPWDGPRFAVLHTPIQPGDPINAVLRGRVDAVFSGHLHRYERRVVDDVLVIVAGNGGKGPGDEEFTRESADAAYSTMDLGFVRVAASRAGTRIEMIDEAGALRDAVEVPPR